MTRKSTMSNFQAYVDQGAGWRKPKTKKALREALLNGLPVCFEDTSGFNNRGTVTADELTPSDVIVGPCAFTARNWYANYRNGRIV